MKAKINTNLFPILYVGMYSSNLDPDNLFHPSAIDSDFEEGSSNYDSEYFDLNFKNDLYVKAVRDLAEEVLDGSHTSEDGITISIVAGEIYSPKFYNFATDQLELEVEYNKNQILKFAKETQLEFDDFLSEHYTSYDGFHSHTANNYEDWLSDFKDDQVQSIGAVLRFIYEEYSRDLQEQFETLCYESLYYWDFVDTKELDLEVKQVIDFVQANYQNFDFSTLDSLELEHLTSYKAQAIAKDTIKDIEANTLELAL